MAEFYSANAGSTADEKVHARSVLPREEVAPERLRHCYSFQLLGFFFVFHTCGDRVALSCNLIRSLSSNGTSFHSNLGKDVIVSLM